LDHLGSTRLITAGGGSIQRRVDYYPFGMQPEWQTDYVPQFTGAERDKSWSAIFGLDYMHARYYRVQLSRFLNPDPNLQLQATTDPQRFNPYTYALNNPLKYVDPDGGSAVLALAIAVGLTMELLAPDVANTPENQADVVLSDRTGDRLGIGVTEAILGPLSGQLSRSLSKALGLPSRTLEATSSASMVTGRTLKLALDTNKLNHIFEKEGRNLLLKPLEKALGSREEVVQAALRALGDGSHLEVIDAEQGIVRQVVSINGQELVVSGVRVGDEFLLGTLSVPK
jgi:RHS repeat-associated protein